MSEVVELRVHGVSGTPPEQLLDSPLVTQVAGDAKAGFYRPRLLEERHDPRDKAGANPADRPLLEGYAWGGLTSGAPTRALWLLLLPFTLTNVAPRLRPRGGSIAKKKPVNLWVLWLTGRLLAISMTALIVAAIAGVSDDLFAWQCTSARCSNAKPGSVMRPLLRLSLEHRLAVGLLLPFAMLALLWLVSGRTIDNYESVPTPSWGSKNISGHNADAIEPTLDSPWMWRNEQQVRRLRHLHLQTGFGTALWVASYPFDNWDALRSWGAVLLAVYIVGLLCCPAYTGRQARQSFYFINIAVWLVLVAAAAAVLSALIWHHPLTSTTAHDGLPGFAGTTLLIFGVQVGLVIVFGVAVVVMALGGRPSGNDNGKKTHLDDPTLPRALGNCAAIVLAAMALFLGAVFSAGAYVYASAWLTTGSLKPGFGAVAKSAAAFHIPSTIREADRAYAVSVGLLVVMILLVVAAFALNRIARLVHLRTWPTAAYKKRLVAAYGDTLPNDPNEADRAKVIAKDFWIARQVDFAHRYLAAVVAAGGVIVVVFSWLLIATRGHHRATNAFTRWHDYPGCPKGTNCGREGLQRWLWNGWLSARSLEGTGAYLVVFTLVLLVALGAAAFRIDKTRRSVGILWDLASFWPRSAHPFAAPCYAERAVPDLTTRLYWYTCQAQPTQPVVLAAHSQGTVISMATISQIAKIDETPAAQADAAPVPKMMPSIAFMTFGCVLRRLYARYFPAYFSTSAIGHVRTVLGGDEPRWRNLWRYTDYLGGQVTAGPPPQTSTDPHPPEVKIEVACTDPQWERPGGDTQWPKPSRHSDYWRDPVFAATVGELATGLTSPSAPPS